MNPSNQSLIQMLRSLRLIWLMLLLGMIPIAAISVAMNREGYINDPADLQVGLLIALIILTAGSLTAGFLLFNRRLVRIRLIESLEQKIPDYRAALILKYTLIDLPAMSGFIFYLLTGSYGILAVAVAMFLLLIIQVPGTRTIVRDLRLNTNDAMLLEKMMKGN